MNLNMNPNVILDIVGDEDDVYLFSEHLKQHLQAYTYNQLLNLDTKKEYKTEMCNIRVGVPIRYVSFDVIVTRSIIV